jgi:hypothetical protein
MKSSSASSRRFMQIHLVLGGYPIMAGRIRTRMRTEMFNRGILQPETFDAEVREMALHSQTREGLANPYLEENGETWQMRLERIRDHLTDLRFSQNLSFEIFERLVNVVLNKQGISAEGLMLSMNLELAPMELVFEYAQVIERMPPVERARHEPRLQQATVVLIRYLISDQLRYINIAKDWFSISRLAEIRAHKIGAGRIGGKAAGMLLAASILERSLTEEEHACISTPESYYIGSGELYTFMSVNDLIHWNNQKYKSEEEMRAEYPQIVQDFEKGDFPMDTLEKLETMMRDLKKKPIIVRSSSLLEDNFGTSFAGKYESIFLPNQGTLQENLRALTRAIARIYASTLNPSALLYRRARGLQDYDERMAILVQEVQGAPFGDYYFPFAAGVAFSRNGYRWAPNIRREDGFVRLVWGMGTRAVDRVGNDYPRMIALSHPLLRPSTDPQAIRRYSQQYVDLINMKSNQFETLPIYDVLERRYPNLRYLVQVDEDGYFKSLRTNLVEGDQKKLIITYDELLRRTNFAPLIRKVLSTLEEYYNAPVDMEFTAGVQKGSNPPQVAVTILQCRPQSQMVQTDRPPIPGNLRRKNMVFSTQFMVSDGYIDGVDYAAFVVPDAYFALPTNTNRRELARVVGKLNAAFSNRNFILIGPGRWGSSNPDLGVPIDYGDIYNTRALIELTGEGIGMAPEPSMGTHFFQDLMEAQIYPLALYLDDPQTVFNRDFFYDTPNVLHKFLPDSTRWEDCLRLVRVSDYRPRRVLRVVMSESKCQAVAFIAAARDSS